jgi:hypothetical protein
MGNYRTTIPIDINITPKELAELFCAMDGDQQAIFFSEIAKIIKSWKAGGFDYQLAYIVDSRKLTKDGSDVMELIGSFAR